MKDDPLPLRLSSRALDRLRQAYPERFEHTIQALRIRCRVAYKQRHLLGLLLAWVSILWQLEIILPSEYGLPSLWQLLARKPLPMRPARLPRAGIRLYYRRARPSRREILISILALLALLPVFARTIAETGRLPAPIPATPPAYQAPFGAATPTPSAATPTSTQTPALRTGPPAPALIAAPPHAPLIVTYSSSRPCIDRTPSRRARSDMRAVILCVLM